jgi:hypothetical protein
MVKNCSCRFKISEIFFSLLMMPLALTYVAVGLMFVTVAIDIFGAHLRRVHNVGRKLGSIANVHVWIGGKRCAV